jgi:hypothetical protein
MEHNKLLNNNNLELVKYLNKFNWDYFITLSYPISTGKQHITKNMYTLTTNNYLIENIFWIIEMSNTGMYHVHCVVKSTDFPKSLTNSSKHSKPDVSRKFEILLNHNNIMRKVNEDFKNGGIGRINTGRLYQQFIRYGNVDFRVIDSSRKTLCLSYITKNYSSSSEYDIIINSSIHSNTKTGVV